METPSTAYLRRLSPGSRPAMAGALRAMSGWTNAQLDALEPGDVAGLRAHAVGLFKPATARRYMAALRGVIRETWRSGAITAEKRDRLLDFPPVGGRSAPVGRALSVTELRLLRIAARPRDRAILAAMTGAGLRRGEIAHLSYVKNVLSVLGKGNCARIIHLTGQAAADVEACPPPWDLGGGGVWAALKRLARRAGVAPFMPHDLRRTYASLALGAGVDLVTLQRAMGHASPVTTAAYDRRTDAQRNAAERVARVLDSPGEEG